MSKRLRKVVFPVAGLGTRFLPPTKVVAKEMLPVLDRPLIQYAVDEAIDAGADTLVFVTNRYKHAIADYFDKAYELESKLAQSGKDELLAVVQGTTAERLVRARHARSGFQLLMARDYDDAFRMLGAHRAQALALDEVLLEGLRATSKTPGAFEIVGSPLADQPERYALVLPNDDPVFKAHVDAALAELFRSGDMAHLQKNWLQTRVPPHGHEIHVDPSEDVLALWQEGGDRAE